MGHHYPVLISFVRLFILKYMSCSKKEFEGSTKERESDAVSYHNF